ncbi:hypothetical protein [Flaviflagellibacter deserti]|uniref:Meckel syndrome type 1 protein n=1 Tax=Flaviflagellibacter deserti TaxID=2267266 RepID=A0ABV9Z164_9HYPH
MKKILYPMAGLALWLGAIASAEAQKASSNPLTGIYNAVTGKKPEPVPPPPGSGLPYAAEQTAVPKGKAAQKPAAPGTAQQQKQAAANAAQPKPATAAQAAPAAKGKAAAAPAAAPQATAAPAPQTAQAAPTPVQPKAKAKSSKKKSAKKASKTRIAKAKSKSKSNSSPETGRATASVPPPADQPAMAEAAATEQAIIEAPVSVVEATSPLAPLVAYREAVYAGDFERAGSLLAKELGQPSDTGSVVRLNALMDINLGVSDTELLAQKAQSASPEDVAELPPPDGSVPVSARIMASHSTAAEAFGRGTVNALASYKEAARMGDAQSAAMALIGAMHGALDETSVKQANALLNVQTDPGFIVAQTGQ